MFADEREGRKWVKIPSTDEWSNGNVIKDGDTDQTPNKKYWVQNGSDIDGEAANDYFGQSVSLSNDGTIVAIGANGNDGNGTASGHVRVYELLTRPTMTITSSVGPSGTSSTDTSINLEFTSSEPTNNFEINDITKSGGTLSDFITVLKVTVQSGSYYINGIQAPALKLESGKTYRFDQSDSTNGTPAPSGHPLRFSTTSNGTHGGGVEYTTGVTDAGTLGQSGSYTQIEITGSTPLYYYCSQHSGMGGSVSIASTNLTKTDEYMVTLTAGDYGTFTIDVAVNSFTDENLLMNLSAPQFSWTRTFQEEGEN